MLLARKPGAPGVGPPAQFTFVAPRIRYASSISPSERKRIAEAPAPIAEIDSEFVTRIQPLSALENTAWPSGQIGRDIWRPRHLLAPTRDLARAEARGQHQPERVGLAEGSNGPLSGASRRGKRLAERARRRGAPAASAPDARKRRRLRPQPEARGSRFGISPTSRVLAHPPALRGSSRALPAMAESRERFPLFPLGLVLLPTELVPLHIFEERYKLMVGECLEGESEFGIVWLADDGLKEIRLLRPHQAGARALRGRAAQHPRGGHGPFRLVRKIEELPYPAGDVELVEDEEAAGEPADSEALVRARARYADLVEEVSDSRPDQGRARRPRRLRHGRHPRGRPRGEAGAARAPLRARAPEAARRALRRGAGPHPAGRAPRSVPAATAACASPPGPSAPLSAAARRGGDEGRPRRVGRPPVLATPRGRRSSRREVSRALGSSRTCGKARGSA